MSYSFSSSQESSPSCGKADLKLNIDSSDSIDDEIEVLPGFVASPRAFPYAVFPVSSSNLTSSEAPRTLSPSAHVTAS